MTTKHDNRDAAVEAAREWKEKNAGSPKYYPSMDGSNWTAMMADFAIAYAAEQVAAERTRIADESSQYLATISDENPIGDGSMLIGMTPNDAYQIGWAVCFMRVNTYIEQLRGADSDGTE